MITHAATQMFSMLSESQSPKNTLYNSTYMKSRTAKLIDTENKMIFARD